MINIEKLLKQYELKLKNLKCSKAELKSYLEILSKNEKWTADDLLRYAFDRIDSQSLEFRLFSHHLKYLPVYEKDQSRTKIEQLKSENRIKYEYVLDLIFKSESYEDFTNYLSLWIILQSGMGNPTDWWTFEVCLAATKSVVNNDDFEQFQITPKEKQFEIIDSYERIVIGIRLFNRKFERVNDSFADLPDLFRTFASAVKESIQDKKKFINNQLNLCIESMQSKLKSLTATSRSQVVTEMRICDVNDNENKLRLFQITFWQSMKLLRQIEMQVEQELQQMNATENELNLIFDRIDEIVCKSLENDILASVIFPQFVNLTSMWYEIKNSILSLIVLDEQSLQLYNFCVSNTENFPGNLSTFCFTNDQFQFEFCGICLYSFVNSNGMLLIPGNQICNVDVDGTQKHFKTHNIENKIRLLSDFNMIYHESIRLIKESANLMQFFDFEMLTIIKKPSLLNLQKSNVQDTKKKWRFLSRFQKTRGNQTAVNDYENMQNESCQMNDRQTVAIQCVQHVATQTTKRF